MVDTIINVIQKIKVKLGFHGVSHSDVLKAGNTAYDGLLNSAAYSNPPVPLPTFRQALDTLNALIVSAEDGGKRAVSALQVQRETVIRMYVQLGHYVEAACNGNLATFNTSGFVAKSKTRTPRLPLGQASFSWIERGPNSGQAVVKVASQKSEGAVAYDVQFALAGGGGVPGPWTTVTLTSPRKVTISGLTPAGTYQFQVRALGTRGYTDWSPATTFIAA